MNLKKLEDVLQKGVDLNICALLYIVKDGEAVESSSPKINAYLELMEKKELIKEGRVTDIGEELIRFLESGEPPTNQNVLGKSIEDLYVRLEAKMIELTGNRQKRVEIFGKNYNYFPGKYDFVHRLKRVINKYKVKDLKKAEEVLIHNIESCKKTNKWFPLLLYYLMKDDISSFFSDYEAWDSIENNKKQEYDGTNI